MILGIGASDGIRIGKIYKYEQIEMTVDKKSISDIDLEIERFVKALKKSEDELNQIRKKTEAKVDSETAAIFGAHIEIVNDPELKSAVETKIREEHMNADFALNEVGTMFISMFETMDNEYFRERASDIKDVIKRVLAHIQGINTSSLSEISEEVIILAKDLTPSDTAQLNKTLIQGFITDIGGRTSHSAIMARTLEIPAVVGTKNGFETISNGDRVILNGTTGEVIVNPTDQEVAVYVEKMKALEVEKNIWKTFKDKASLTKDNKPFEIGGNIGSPKDLEGVKETGGECIGLYRTEFLYMGKNNYPSEDEQFEAYKEVLEKMEGKPVIVRTLDIGGDKELSYLKMDKEMNPFLGNRALRLCFHMPEMFKTQIRALLRASVYGQLHIMFPMIATLNEIKKAKAMILEVQEELIREKYEIGDYKIGMMVEIPAAAILADVLVKEVDFFSIGTNDLIQYTFAADRMNEKVSYLYQPFNPSLLRLIKMVIDASHNAGKWTGMCGEMAGEIKALPLLIGLGIDELSMSASGILRTRYLASKIDAKKAEILLEKAIM